MINEPELMRSSWVAQYDDKNKSYANFFDIHLREKAQ